MDLLLTVLKVIGAIIGLIISSGIVFAIWWGRKYRYSFMMQFSESAIRRMKDLAITFEAQNDDIIRAALQVFEFCAEKLSQKAHFYLETPEGEAKEINLVQQGKPFQIFMMRPQFIDLNKKTPSGMIPTLFFINRELDARLETVSSNMEAKSKREVISTALRVLEWLVEADANGNTVYFTINGKRENLTPVIKKSEETEE